MSITFSGADHTRRHPRFPEFPLSVELEYGEPGFLNLCNANAFALLSLLGLDAEDSCGSCSLADARRGIMRARASFERRAPAFERAPAVEYAAPRTGTDGVVELKPIRYLSPGFDASDLLDRLDRFAVTVEALASRGATHITWG